MNARYELTQAKDLAAAVQAIKLTPVRSSASGLGSAGSLPPLPPVGGALLERRAVEVSASCALGRFWQRFAAASQNLGLL